MSIKSTGLLKDSLICVNSVFWRPLLQFNIRVTALGWLFLSGNTWAATYYVAVSGSDSNPGTASQPFRTIQKGVNSAYPGDIVLITAGEYPEQVTSVRHGTQANRITIRGTNSPVVGCFVLTHEWIVIEDLTINYANASTSKGGIWLTDGPYGVRAANNATIRRVNLVGGIPGGLTGAIIAAVNNNVPLTNTWVESCRIINPHYIAVSLSDYTTITNCYFFGTNGWDAIRGPGSNSRIVGNVFTNWSNLINNPNHSDIIQAFTYTTNTWITNVVFERNIVVDCIKTQLGMFEDQARGGTIGNWTFRNNVWANVESAMHIYIHTVSFYNDTFYRSGRNTAGPILFRASTDRGNGHNGTVMNCIFVECGSNPASPTIGWYAAESSVTNFTANYNLVRGTGVGTAKTGFQTNGREAQGLNGLDPLFVDPKALNFRLQSGSPAINAGTLLTGFSEDFQGTPRIGTWDIGAFEYVAAGTLLPPKALLGVSQSPDDEDPLLAGVQVFAGRRYRYSGPHGNYAAWQWLYSVDNGPEIVHLSGVGAVLPADFTYPAGSAGQTYRWKLSVDFGDGTKGAASITATVR